VLTDKAKEWLSTTTWAALAKHEGMVVDTVLESTLVMNDGSAAVLKGSDETGAVALIHITREDFMDLIRAFALTDARGARH
jgi:hypothetical protein